MAVTVTMQLNVGENEAGDWANRPAVSGTRTIERTGRYAGIAEPGHELMLRLHDLRNAVEAMKQDEFGPSLAATLSKRASFEYGAPAAYHGLRFVTRVHDTI